jgi:sulfofructosephosphate aldolase
MQTAERIAAFQAIARPRGGFAIVADDGRESLRGILTRAGRPADDADLTAFKTLVAEQLGPVASALLVDLVYGSPSLDALERSVPSCGRIVAVDTFHEERLGPLEATSLDRARMTPEVAARAHALKFYIHWRPEQPASERAEEVRAFVEGCAALGVLSVLEGVVKLPGEDPRFDDALVAAAEEFGAFGPDVYKTQVPTFGRDGVEAIERESRRVTDAVGAPWVALSNGVAVDRFPDAVSAVCRGGASGFLAGRGAWSPAVSAEDPAAELASAGRERLAELAERVDRDARPWWVAAGIDPALVPAA